jgi:hypothetical protein
MSEVMPSATATTVIAVARSHSETLAPTGTIWGLATGWQTLSECRLFLQFPYIDNICISASQLNNVGYRAFNYGSWHIDSWHMGSSCATPLGAAPLALGGDTNGNRIVGDIAELITFRSAVSDSTLATIEAYLADKYGLSLASRCVNPPNCASLNRVACSNTEANPFDTCGACLAGYTHTSASGNGFSNEACANATPSITQ